MGDLQNLSADTADQVIAIRSHYRLEPLILNHVPCSHSSEQAVIVLNDELTIAEIVTHFRERKQILLLHYATAPFLAIP